ncbi:head GIN domain-containing protein [Flavobacterium sp.]|uniref:head GIN domain-containing protein n=1 Tax=Flavobacterium sp. TaxID=239 RepID=UPI002638F22F|nr:head GIN domain-containing protein [Flavobacterium sp.]
MKKIIYSFLLVSSIAFAQTDTSNSELAKQKSVGDFNKVTSFDQIDVLLIPSDENKVVLDGSGSEDVEIVNKNGELKIRMRLTKMLSGDNISATVYYKNIDAVEANEGSRISSEATFEATIFDIKAKEGSQIKIKINVDRLTARIGNGSTVTVSGTAKNQDVLINSGGIYEAERLETNQTIITANAGGDADVYATDLVDAKVRAGGDIRIFGKPKQINQKIIAGGTIKEGND